MTVTIATQPEPVARMRAVRSPWLTVGQGAAAMAAGMGVGRFVYTPILPLMHAQAGMSASTGAALAIANYAGYLAGAIAGVVFARLTRSAVVFRASLVVLVASLALMPAGHNPGAWIALRFVAGGASALIFIYAAAALLSRLRRHAHHLVGWGFGGVGGGIALSGALVLVVRSFGGWQSAWLSAAALTLVLTAAAWVLPSEPAAPAPAAQRAQRTRTTPHSFATLLLSYSLEGVGYIIAGTFLVAAIDQSSGGWIGSAAWVLVGLAALPSTALWAWLARIWSRPALLIVALAVQAVGVALPALSGGATAAVISAVLFGATFLGVAAMALAIGAHLQAPQAVALLTVGYSAGQILGPLAVAPLLRDGYHSALLAGAGIIALAALVAGVLRVRFPHRLGPLPSRVHAAAIRRQASD